MTTNNRMELMAAIKGLEALKEKCNVALYSDSKYVIDALEKGWALKWRANGWRRNKKDAATNSDLWGRLLELCESHETNFHWVKGHAGDPDNERCDRLATEAATQPDLSVDEPYESTRQRPLEQYVSLSTTDEDPSSISVESVRRDLKSPDPYTRRQAIIRSVTENITQLGGDLLVHFRSEMDPEIKGRFAWALGRLNYGKAEETLLEALNNPDKEVRVWSAWALGEIGSYKAESILRRAIDDEHSKEVKQAIGGAIKKLNLVSTRVHAKQLKKELQRPETQDQTLLGLMERLETLDLATDYESIVELRAEMQSNYPEFFKKYMAWVRRKPEIIAALNDRSKVFP